MYDACETDNGVLFQVLFAPISLFILFLLYVTLA